MENIFQTGSNQNIILQKDDTMFWKEHYFTTLNQFDLDASHFNSSTHSRFEYEHELLLDS